MTMGDPRTHLQLTLSCVATLEPAGPPGRPRLHTSAVQFLAVMARELAFPPDVRELLDLTIDELLHVRNHCERCRLHGEASCRLEGCRAFRRQRALALRLREVARRLEEVGHG